MGYMAQCATIWLTVLIAVNRYIAICHPFNANRFLTIRTARIQVLLHFVIVAPLSPGLSLYFTPSFGLLAHALSSCDIS